MNFRKTIKHSIILALSGFVLSGCTLPGLGSGASADTVAITSGASTEAQIIGSVVEEMIKHYTDIPTELINNLGTSTINHQAVVQGDADIGAIRYTGTDLTGALQMDPVNDPKVAFDIVVEEFDKQFDQKWYPSYGFANTYAFLVTQELAKEYNLETVSDLEPIAQELTAGADNSWIERKGDGYQGFLDTYKFDFDRFVPMQIGLVYDALQAGQMDVVLGYSTDGRISSYDLKVLEDDLNLFPPYDASPLATQEILEKYPVLNDVLLKLEDTITTEKMQELNFIADNNLEEPKNVALTFLEENNYFETKAPVIEIQKGGK